MQGQLQYVEFLYALIGSVAVIAYARQRFDVPSFPDQETLPQVVEPIRYLFLGSTYKRARLAYVGITITVYFVLLLPGFIIGRGPTGGEIPLQASGSAAVTVAHDVTAGTNFPIEAWPLLVALILVGMIPNSNAQWINAIEVWLRRLVHSFFLVPDGTMRTIGVLEDARYDPPPNIRDSVRNARKADLLTDLKAVPGSLDYQWARATMLLESLKRRDGAAGPLGNAVFDPFVKDYDAIREKYKALESDVDAFRQERSSLSEERGRSIVGLAARSLTKRESDLADWEDKMLNLVNKLLRRIYAYLSWAIRQKAKTEKEVYDILEELGFNIPTTGTKRLFDAVAPAIISIFAITFIFWTAHDWLLGNGVSKNAVGTLYSSIAAAIMYGMAISIALKKRAAQIDDKTWNQSLASCYASTALTAGVCTWVTIAVSTMLSSPAETASSLIGTWDLIDPEWLRISTPSPSVAWYAVPVRIVTAFPWVFAGAAAGTLLALSLGRDVRRTRWPDRLSDALSFGCGLGLAAALAQYFQMVLTNPGVEQLARPSVEVGLAGMCCGLAVGFLVPGGCRSSIVRPMDSDATRTLRELLTSAESALGGKSAAEEWVFRPLRGLGGISPAEAIQHKSQVKGVWQKLGGEPPRPEAKLSIFPVNIAS